MKEMRISKKNSYLGHALHHLAKLHEIDCPRTVDIDFVDHVE